jgi:DNA-binding response OmpR family regulator
MRVLVIEDDDVLRETLGVALEAYDHTPILRADGRAAMEYLATEWPDVMVLDLTLLEMTGEETYERINARFGRVPPTIVISGQQQGALRARHLPGARFLAKPYTLEQLEASIQAIARQ